ncbi:MAG: class I SAM-dependent methyltransferase [bacterium]|nr:class I SAM-dependent methyltransferase [bacterium]
MSQDYDRYWDEKRGRGLGRLSDWQQARADIVSAYLKHDQGLSIADIGCGDGSILRYIGERVSVSEMVGYDISTKALSKANDFGIKGYQFDINNPDYYYQLQEIDYCLMLEVLEHTIQSEKLLGAAYSSSRKGVFFSIPNSGFYFYRLRLLFGKFPAQWRIFPNEHVRFWTLSDLRWWLNALDYKGYTIHAYKGIPVLNKIWPALFAAALVVYLPKK